jgi:hypothetical protein
VLVDLRQHLDQHLPFRASMQQRVHRGQIRIEVHVDDAAAH